MSSPASSQPKKPKSILKKPTAAPPTTPAPAAPAVAISPFPIEEHTPSPAKPSARDAAVQQALIIQQQQALEDEIQDAILELAKFPLVTNTANPSDSDATTTTASTTFSAENPSPTDASRFRHLIRPFQPGDFEDLITERNTLGRCGYALCPSPKTSLGPRGGTYKLVGWGRPDFSIVPRKELERWCSPRCARRAMYVKVQLQETAAWERAAAPSVKIDLLDEPKAEKEEAPIATPATAENEGQGEEDKERKAARDARDLALERGDPTEAPSTKQIQLTIREKRVTTTVQEPSLAKDKEDHLILDGYKTKFDGKVKAPMKGINVTEAALDALESLTGV
ncbi:hypothetical protein GGS26DRAFT_464936 [Hypomontagnella submonticulosa]|nr:hypothetical protein GGS26DRAFT_464936 [Hypomontagnella submonticulosa]